MASAIPADGAERTGDPALTAPAARCQRSAHFGRVIAAAVCLGLLATPPALADVDSPVEQLRQMAHSLRALDYRGSFVYQNGPRIDALHIVHSSTDNERERMTRLSGSPSETTRHGESISVHEAGKAAVSFSAGTTARLLPLVPTDAVSLPNENYRLTMAEPDRVAGYETSVVDIAAADGYRYNYRIWLGREHHLPLRVALLDENHRTVEQYMFVDLSVGTVSAVELGVVQTTAATSGPIVAALDGSQRWIVNDLPRGFSLRARQAMPSSAKTSEHLVFSDGLASVSAYIEATPEPVSDDVALSRGAMNVYIHRDRSWRYTVLGNVPAATVQRIALSINTQQGASKPN